MVITTLKPEFICYRPSLGATEGITEASRGKHLEMLPGGSFVAAVRSACLAITPLQA